MDKEKFALYGFEAEIPNDWRVELNPKTTRLKGDVVFQSPKGNRIFISWGVLADATKRFKSLEEQRDRSVEQIRKGPDVKSAEISASKEDQIGGHRALVTHVSASLKSGMFSKHTTERDVLSVHFHCRELSRYYVVYSLMRDPSEFSDFGQIFSTMTKSFSCHPALQPTV